jgi:hypothetical protein
MRLQNQTDGINHFKHERFETMMPLNWVPTTHNKLHKTIMSIATSKFQLTIAFRIVHGKQANHPHPYVYIYHQIG